MARTSRIGGPWLRSPLFAWLLLALPGVYWVLGYARGTLFYGEVVHATGVFATQLLIVTLALTPLRRWLPRARWLGWLRQRRRYLGVAAFAYALMHALVYLLRQQNLARIVDDLQEAAMWTGWLALLVMLPLAATSNDAAVRRLKWRWQLLHRAVYLVAVLSFAHWILSAFDPVPAYIYLAVLAALEVLRLLRPAIARRARRARRQSARP